MKILHSTYRIGKESQGLGIVAINLAKHQNDLGGDTRIWCCDRIEEIRWASESHGINENRIVSFQKYSIGRFAYSREMISAAKCKDKIFDIIHQHGIWTPCSVVSNIFRNKKNTPIIIAPHGSLQKWAIEKSRWKKKAVLCVYEKENLINASCLHATSENEIDDFRNYGLKSPIALIDNGVSEKSLFDQGYSERFLRQYCLPREKNILLYLSRITPKKGLPILLKAIARVKNELTKWVLVIAGSDEFNHKRELEDLVDKLNLRNIVKFVGPLYDQIKLDAFAASNALILPSYGEGAPMIVLDSLAAGVPVITTTQTSWGKLVQYRCGWCVDASVDSLVNALIAMASLKPNDLKKMGMRGKELIRKQFLWSDQAKKTLELYAWILRTGQKPDFVVSS